MKEKEEQTKVKYIRQNGKDVEGEVAIEAVRKQQLKDCVRNTRLGNYNRFGRYIMSPGIINDLLRVTKYIHKDHFKDAIEDSKGGIELKASSYLPVFGELEFRLVIKDKFAKLYIMESVYRELNGYQEIYGEEVVESFCDDDKADIIEYNLALFNMKVVDKNDIDGKKLEDLQEDSEIVENILAQKVFLSIVAKNYLKGSITDEKETFEEIVEKLKTEGGEYGKRVLKHFIDRIEKRPDIMQIPEDGGYNEALNDMLVGAMEVATTEDDMLDPNIAKLYEDIYDIRYRKTDRQMDDATQGVTPESLQNVLGRLGVELTGDPQKEDGSTPREGLQSIIDAGRNAVASTEEDRGKPSVTLGSELFQKIVDSGKASGTIATMSELLGKMYVGDSTKVGDAATGKQLGSENHEDLLKEVQGVSRDGPGEQVDTEFKKETTTTTTQKQKPTTTKKVGGGGNDSGKTTDSGKQKTTAYTGYEDTPGVSKQGQQGGPQNNPENNNEELDLYSIYGDQYADIIDDMDAMGLSDEEKKIRLDEIVNGPQKNTTQAQGGIKLNGSAQTDGGPSQTGRNTHMQDGLSHTSNHHNQSFGGQGGDGGRGYGDE